MNSWCGGYCYPLHHQQFFHESCVTVSYNKIIDYSRLISTISTFILDGYSCSSAAQRSAAPGGPPPPTSDGGPGSGLCSGYMIIWLSLVNVYTNEMSISLDYPGQDRLPNWLSGVSQPLALRGMHAFTSRVLLAAMLTMSLAHIPPLGEVLFISWVRIFCAIS